MNDLTKYSTLNLDDLVVEANEHLGQDRLVSEAANRDNLRIGNAGFIDDNGDVHGCHRSAIARALGLDNAPIDRIARLFFTVGSGVENELTEQLRGHKGIEVKAEEECPAVWQLNDHRKITGRPDIMVNKDGHRLGVEVKTACAVNTAHRLWFEDKPDSKHLAQAAAYSMIHQVPWVLHYISPIRHDVNYRTKKALGLPFRSVIDPFRLYYYMRFDEEGRLYYRNSMKSEEVRTIITKEGIENFYLLVDECLKEKELWHNPVSQNAVGDPAPYKHEKYCEYCKAATEAQGDWDTWIDHLHALGEVDV